MAVDIILDAGHGGFDNGATYRGRAEKDDVLQLTLDVGKQLEKDGYTVAYIRTEDVYESPYQKAERANQTGGEIFISFHRNSAVEENLYHGVQALVYSADGKEAVALGENINKNLEQPGFQNLGVEAIPDLIVLHKTQMPAVLMEVGFINSDVDNKIWDERYPDIVKAIVSGVEETVSPKQKMEPARQQMAEPAWNQKTMEPTWDQPKNILKYEDADNKDELVKTPETDKKNQTVNLEYTDRTADKKTDWEKRHFRRKFYVQTGLFKYDVNAAYQLERLQMLGFDGMIHYGKPYYAVWIGETDDLDAAVRTQRELQEQGYQTLIVSE